MKKLDTESLRNDESGSSQRLPKLESVLRSELGAIMERELELPLNTLLTITAVQVLPDLSQARVKVSILPIEKSSEVYKILLASASELQRLINQRFKLYRVPRLVWQLDDSMEQAGRIDQLLDNIEI